MSSTVTVPLKGAGGEDKGQLEVHLDRFDSRVRYTLLKEAALMYLANERVGTHETKTRSEVNYSNKKPWKQKGTGRARSGTRRSPLWRGGGIIFGPHARDYSFSINRKQKRVALRSALFAKVRDGQVIVVDGLHVGSPNTKAVAQVLKSIGVSGGCLIGTSSHDKNLYLSARNIPGVVVAPVKDFNSLQVLNARRVVLLKDAFDALMEGLGKGAEA